MILGVLWMWLTFCVLGFYVGLGMLIVAYWKFFASVLAFLLAWALAGWLYGRRDAI